jgi:anthranilate/para-aminobenzoate synthase component I
MRLTGVVLAVPRERDRLLLVVDRGLTDADPARIRRWVQTRLDAAAARPDVTEDLPTGPGIQVVTSSLPHAEHAAAVRAVLALIGAGAVYQVNLAQRLAVPWERSLAELYRRLRAASPASHAALLPAEGIASASPERFLAVRAGVVVTEPIKEIGTYTLDIKLHAEVMATITVSVVEG